MAGDLRPRRGFYREILSTIITRVFALLPEKMTSSIETKMLSLSGVAGGTPWSGQWR
jgi:hypothetical protein